MAGLITLEATPIDGPDASPVGLLRAPAEQAAKLTHVEFLFPLTQRGVIGRCINVEFVANWFRVVEPRFALSEAFVELSLYEDQRDLHPLGEPAVAVRRSGFVWLVNMRLARFLHCHISGRLDLISPDRVRFIVNFMEIS